MQWHWTGARLHARAATVHALLGENRAGKTTLMQTCFGLMQPDGSELRVHGIPVRFGSPADAISHGLEMVHQRFAHLAAMTVAENVALGGHGRCRPTGAARAVINVGRRTGLPLDPEARVENLSVGGQQRLEILKALSRDAHILIIDEPTAVLTPSEAAELLSWARQFAGAGNTIVLITHNLRESLAVADDVTVLRHRQTVLEAPSRHVASPALVLAMVGENVTDASVPPSAAPDAVVARAVNMTLKNVVGLTAIHHATLDVRASEIVGVAGLERSGHRELMRALAGRLPLSLGSLICQAALGSCLRPRTATRWCPISALPRTLHYARPARTAASSGGASFACERVD